MAISADLMRAILAVDAYSCGYNSSINSLSSAIRTRIGDAKIIRTSLDAASQPAGFML